jgi:hypothetical protein
LTLRVQVVTVAFTEADRAGSLDGRKPFGPAAVIVEVPVESGENVVVAPVVAPAIVIGDELIVPVLRLLLVTVTLMDWSAATS